jgi:hypothetical protein
VAVGADGSTRPLGDARFEPTDARLRWSVARVSIDVRSGERPAVEAVEATAIQSVRGFVPAPDPPAGWLVGRETDDAVTLERAP